MRPRFVPQRAHAAHRRPLGEVQASVQAVRADIAALQVRLGTRKTRVLFVFSLLALPATLMLAWILYSQIVVIRHYRRRADDVDCATQDNGKP